MSWASAELGGELAASDLSVSIEAPGAEANLTAIFFPRGSQHVDVVSTVEHRAGDATSETIVKTAARERGQARFLGNIRIAPHAQGSDARLRDDALLLSPTAHVDSVPALEIGANVVKAYHGATVGAIDAEQIFYMESRGLERGAAERMIALGFFEPAIERFPTVALRDEIRAVAGGKAFVTQTLRSDAKTERIIADFPILARPTSRGKRLVYLDSAATSQKPRAVIQALVDYYEQYNANIHRGVYEIAQRATDEYEQARVKLARFIGAETSEVVWVRNTTEAINLVAYSWGDHNVDPGDAILLTELEHHRISSHGSFWRSEPAPSCASFRSTLAASTFSTISTGCSTAASSSRSRTSATRWERSRRWKRSSRARTPPVRVVLVDGAQGAPHLPLDVKALDADFYAFSGHKMLGPTGIGCLYGKRELLEAMPPFLSGGDMIRKVEYTQTTFADPPRRFEAGTSNIADAIAFGVAADYLSALGMPWVREHERALTGYALKRLCRTRAAGPCDLRAARSGTQLWRHLVQLRRHPPARSRLDSGYRRRLHTSGPSLHDAADGKVRLGRHRPRVVLHLQYRGRR